MRPRAFAPDHCCMEPKAASIISTLCVVLLATTMVLAACSPSGASTAFVSDRPTPSSTPVATVSREVTKPPVSQAPLPAPTNVRWAMDRSPHPGRRLFELHYDGAAMGFRVVDESGRQLIVLPIAGSGVFGPETCMATAKAPTDTATWVGMDEPVY